MKKLIKKLTMFALAFIIMGGAFAISAENSEAFAATNKARVYAELKASGYSKAAAAGIMANIKHESNYNPNAGRGAYGLIQWTGSRKRALKRYAKSKKLSYKSVKAQIGYMNKELKSGYKGLYKHLKTVKNNKSGAYKAAHKFCYDFERPANKSSRSKKRGNTAKKIYSKLA
ncbi:hypothetical protein SAMN04487759_12810 [Kandleria vitulina]|uniref:Phage tail lysozyme domain-containing protein n=1 Tax=Kandleria vitulina TaxID=1630 RepID=A0A1H2V3F7_9FIRM|nr:phage tail tip lysozyme [Kandleria vitulina]SDW62876.1 hypothetical protein SAMN04487759_12810 [Kandleria vitulina]HAD24047.1 hypothetical protein [Kandleria vitulina]HAH74720.1 hypothetical protein [Kandleria vitulina]HBG67329.1 hypothetical protein [Kandleria vitulina]HCY53461.1 hypothetical protein [Kandleria vitulina]